MAGRLVVENHTGHALHVAGCGSLFQLDLVGSTYQPAVNWPACLQEITIPVGTSSYRMTVTASYNQCDESGSQGTARACLPSGMPPLAPGHYAAELFQSSHVLPAPPGIPVRVTPR